MKLLSPANLIGILFAGSIVFLLDYYDYWTGFLTHPFWSSKVSMIGMGIGFALAVVTLFISAGNKMRIGYFLAMFVLVAGITYLVTSQSKEVFAASYAENILAGKIWYFGFMGFTASLYAALSLVPPFILGKQTN